MKSVAIITARGGSKRIPKKNIRDFCGKPIIAYSIEAALKSGVFDEVMVSTDSEEIVDVAKKYGAEVPFMRSAETSNDYAGTNDVLLEVLDMYKKRGELFDIMSCIYPTAPFISSEKIIEAYRLVVGEKAKVVMSVVAFSYPPQRALEIDENTGCLGYIYPDKFKCRSQDLKKWYHDAGQFYFYDVEEFLNSKGEMMRGIYPIIVPETEVQDIDVEEDWIIAEMKYKQMKKCI